MLVDRVFKFGDRDRSGIAQPVTDVLGIVVAQSAVQFGSIASRYDGRFAYVTQVMSKLAQKGAKIFLWKGNTLPQLDRSCAMIKSVCHYAHEAMIKFSAGNNSRMRTMPLAAFRPVHLRVAVFWLGWGLMLLQSGGCMTNVLEPVDAKADFVVQGKLMLARGGDKSAMRFAWRQIETDYVIDVWGALGQGRVQLRGNAEVMQVTQGSTLILAGEPEPVMQKQLGWSVPVSAIRHWLLGRPMPEAQVADYAVTADGLSVRFRQRAWDIKVDLDRAADNSPDVVLPRRLTLNRDDTTLVIRVAKYTRNVR